MKPKKKIQTIQLSTRSSRPTSVRRNRKASTPRMTRGKYHGNSRKLAKKRTNNWRAWWRWGCGSVDGVPTCPPGHRYYGDKNSRKSKASLKKKDRRRTRRTNKRVDLDD